MVLETIAKCDVDIRKELYGGVVLTGGTALLTGVSGQCERVGHIINLRSDISSICGLTILLDP